MKAMHRDTTVAAYLFLLLLSVYWLTYSGMIHSIDEASTLSVAESLVKQGTWTTDQLFWAESRGAVSSIGVDGHAYSPHSLLHALSIAPLYAIGLYSDGLGATQMALLYSPLITALTAVAVYALVRQLGYAQGVALTISLLFGLATPAWVYAKFLFKDSLIALTLTLAVLASVDRTRSRGQVNAILAGLFVGLGFLTRPTIAFVAPFFLGHIVLTSLRARPGMGRFKRAATAGLCFLVPLLLAFGFQGFYNATRFGLPWYFGQPMGAFFGSPPWPALYALFLSPEKGLLFYAPVALLGILGGVPFTKRYPREGLLVVVTVAICASTHAMSKDWAGGLAWGPRFLVALLPLMLLPAAPIIDAAMSGRISWRLIAIGLLGAISFSVQVLGVGVNYLSAAKGHPDTSFYEQPTPSLDFSGSPILWQLEAWQPGNCDLAILWGGYVNLVLLVSTLAIVVLAVAGLIWQLRAKQDISYHVGRMGLWLLGMGSLLALISLSLPRYYQDGRFIVNTGLINLFEQLPERMHDSDCLVSLTPFEYMTFLNYYKGPAPHVGLALQQPPLEQPTVHLLDDVVLRYPRVWLLTDQDVANTENGVEEWLSRYAHKVDDDWHGGYRVGLYAVGATELAERPLDVDFEGGIALDAAAIPARPLHRGDALPVRLDWRATSAVDRDLVVFLHLDDDDGRGWAGRDSAPADGYRPTSSWLPGETVVDRRGLVIPPDAPTGRYRLRVGLYEPTSLQRLAATDGAGRRIDSAVDIGSIEIVE